MKKYQLPQVKILSTKLGIAIINTLKFISVLEKRRQNKPIDIYGCCEQTADTGLTKSALVGHSSKNFTVNKPYDCLLLCFVEKNRCHDQAFQMMDEHNCELLNEDRFDASGDFVE